MKKINKLIILVSVIMFTYPGFSQNGKMQPTAASSFGEDLLIEQVQNTKPVNYMTDLSISDALQTGGDRLVEMQHTDGAWGWPLIAPPTYGNILGPIAMGLAQAYESTSDVDHLAGLTAAGGYFLTKTNNFSPSDGYLAAKLDEIFGETTYVDHVTTNFYGPLAAGTYDRNGAGTLYSTASYVNLIRTARASGGIGNLAAWDIGMGLVGAESCGASTTDWISGVKAEIDELDGAEIYDVIGLTGAIYGLAFVGEDYTPTGGEHFGAADIGDLADILAGYQINLGGFTWTSLSIVSGEEACQVTGYAILALNEVDRDGYLTNISGASNYMRNVQLVTGGWEDEVGDGENNEVTGEALWGIKIAGTTGYYNSTTGNYYATLQDAIDAASDYDVIEIAVGTSAFSTTININKPITIKGTPTDALTLIQTSGSATLFNVTAANVTIQDLEIEKTDKVNQTIIYVGGNSFELHTCEIHGQFVMGDGQVERGMVVVGGLTGFYIHDNSFYGLRQPAYINNGVTGNIDNNYTAITKGWVVVTDNIISFAGNTWGSDADVNYYDIALINQSSSVNNYPDIVTMSNNNNDAIIENQHTSYSPYILSIVHVDGSVASTGNGSILEPYKTIAEAIPRVAVGGTINVLAGTYAGNIIINKSLTLLGNPGDDSPGPGTNAPVIDGGGANIDAIKITNGVTNVTIKGFVISNFSSPGYNTVGSGIQAWVGSTSYITVQDNSFLNLGYNGILVGNDYSSNPANWGDHTNWTVKKNIASNCGYIGFELTNTSNSSIEDNVIHLNTPYIGAIFSSARRSESDLTIKNNLIDGTPSTVYPVIYIYAYDVDMPNPNLDNVLIEGNDIQTTGTPFQVNVRNVNTGTVTGVTVYHNKLSTLNNLTAAQINAENNYWGTILSSEIAAKVSGDVDYTPWCNSSFSICSYTGAGPITTIPTLTEQCYNATISVPVTVTDFNNVGAISLVLNYDPLVLSVPTVTWNSLLPFPFTNTSTAGTVVFSWINSTGYNLVDNATLFTLEFTYIGTAPCPSPAATALTWNDSDPTYLEYATPDGAVFEDDPYTTYYINGSVEIKDITDPVITTCPPTQDVEGCTTDDITNGGLTALAYSETLVTVIEAQFISEGGDASDNCSGILTYSYVDVSSGIYPVVVTRTWTVTDACGNFVTCEQTINIDDTILPTITCPSPASYYLVNNVCLWTASGLEFVAYDDNCETPSLWYSIDGAAFVSCNDQGVNGLNFPIGDTQVTYKAIDPAGNESITCSFTIHVDGITVTGTVEYYNAANTPMDLVSIILQQGGTNKYTTAADGSGVYTFTDVCLGTYDIVVSTGKDNGGINSTDAAQVNYWGVTPSTIEMVRFNAGDVNGGLSVNGADAGLIQQYFLTLGNPTTPFATEWTFWNVNELISANPAAGGYPQITVDDAVPSITHNMYALVTGDFNRSFTPGTGAKGTASETLTLNYGEVLEVGSTEFELPLYAGLDMEVGAISLILNVPSELLEVHDVYLGNDPTIQVLYSVIGDELRISWQSLTSVSLQAGDPMLTLKLCLNGLAGDEGIMLSLATDPLNELANDSFDVIDNAVLVVDVIHTMTLGMSDFGFSDELSLGSQPNPFQQSTNFVYSLPINGKVTLEVYDLLGNKVKTLVDEAQNVGEHQTKFDANIIQPGVYMAILKVQNSEIVLTRTIKIISKQ